MSTPSLLSTYRSFVKKKEAPPALLSPDEVRLVHGCLGLATELLELAQSTERTNTLEELGDLLWYLTLLADILQMPIQDLCVEFSFNPHQNELPFDLLEQKAEAFLSLAKKQLIYRSEVLPQLITSYGNLWMAFLVHCHACNVPLDLLIAENMEKLDARYASTFSQKESEVRRDKQDEEDL